MFKGAKIIIPKPMRQEMLMRIHTGHMGIQKSKERARDVLFCIGLTWRITYQDVQLVKNIKTFHKENRCFLTAFQVVHGKWWERTCFGGTVQIIYS
jgi:hypothetical protein